MKAGRKPVKTIRRGSVEIPIYSDTYAANGRNYSRFVIEYHDGPNNRKRVKRSKLETAIKEANRIATDISTGDGNILKLTGADRESYLLAKKKLEPTGLPLVEAVSQFVTAFELLPKGATLWEAANALAEQRKQVRNPITVADAKEKFVDEKEKAGKSREHIKKLRSRIGRLADTFKMEVHRLTEEMLTPYFDSLDLAPRTIENHISEVTSFFRWAVKKKHAHEGLLKEIDAVERPSVDQPEIAYFTPAEIREMLEACRPALLPQLVICTYSGIRKSEARRLDWSQVKLDRGFIELKAGITKNRDRRLAPLTGHAIEWLRPYAKPKGKVFYYAHDNKFNAAIVEDVNAARVKADREPDFAWRKNGLRDSYISYRTAATKNIPQVALEAGNSPAMIQKHYLEAVTEQEAAEYFGISPVKPDNVIEMKKEAA